MDRAQQSILHVIDWADADGQPASARYLATTLGRDVDDLAEQVAVMERAGWLHVTKTESACGCWNADLTPAGRQRVDRQSAALVSPERTAQMPEVAALETITTNILILEQAGAFGASEGLACLTNSATLNPTLTAEEQDYLLGLIEALSSYAAAMTGGRRWGPMRHALLGLRERLCAHPVMAEGWARCGRTFEEYFDL